VRAAERRAQFVRLTTEWGRVATCEEGGWGNSGAPLFPNSLGIMAGPPGGWFGHGGGYDLRPWTQIKVARLEIDSLVGQDIQGTTVYPGFVPDQAGCSAW
jgi:hypothetical protein